MDRNIYNQYKHVVKLRGDNVKNNLVKYMQSVIKYDIPNADTIEAIEEVKQLKANPNKKTYGSFAELLQDIDND
jgi:hypothetical protein